MPLSPRLKWKINRYSRKMEERLERMRNLFKSVMNPQRMCPACRALIDRKEKTCPFCGERVTAARPVGIWRLLDALLPQQARYTRLLLTVNVALFGLMLAASSLGKGGGFDLNALLGSLDVATLVRFGAKYGLLLAAGQWWRFLTPVFLHASLLHLAFNSWVLYDLGPSVESLYGPRKFLVLYVVSGAAGFVASYVWRPYGVSVGASGSLFGLIGAMIAYGYHHRRSVSDAERNMFVRWAIYMLVFGFLIGGVDNAAHIGGLLAGLAFGTLVSDMPSVTQLSIYFWKVLSALTILLVVFGFGMLVLRPAG